MEQNTAVLFYTQTGCFFQSKTILLLHNYFCFILTTYKLHNYCSYTTVKCSIILQKQYFGCKNLLLFTTVLLLRIFSWDSSILYLSRNYFEVPVIFPSIQQAPTVVLFGEPAPVSRIQCMMYTCQYMECWSIHLVYPTATVIALGQNL